MPTAALDLVDVVTRLADRRTGRTEANVQSYLHLLLTAAPLGLGDEDLQEIVLEAPAGQRRRIDVEVGFTVFEVKRDLRVGNVRADAVDQLAGYVASRVEQFQQRYVGVLTDGAEWHLYHLVDGVLVAASSFELTPRALDMEGLIVWLEGVLATAPAITPTPREIERRLGATSPGHALDVSELTALYRRHRDDPTVTLKRQLWAKLLTTAFGTNFRDEDQLFVEHTLLVATAEIIGHALVGFDPADPTLPPATLLAGRLFAQAQIGGVVEADFFDWPVDVAEGAPFVRQLARRLTRFAWRDVEHDVMKVLYESVIAADQRHGLGEYYTPDWLAEAIVEEVVTDPLEQRVLDPGCGSGTFLFHAVRRYLAAAADAGRSPAEALTGVTGTVAGVDVHPVAVTFARITYLLAIGVDRLQAEDRPAFSVPVYLGDSVQWGQEQHLFSAGALIVATDDGAMLFADQLTFPERLLEDAGRFDRLVAELADKAADRGRGSPVPSLAATFRRFAVHPEDQTVVATTFTTMCQLHDQGRDHIWGYYVRNLARPTWLRRPPNRVDVLVGNPPWLSYRFMTEQMRAAFRGFSEARGFWAGAAVATHQDLSALFVARCAEQYLAEGGRFGFVMPLAVLSRRSYAGFRTGRWGAGQEPVFAGLSQPWDLHRVKPSFFPVPAAVVFGSRAKHPQPLPTEPERWAGRLPARDLSYATARPLLDRTSETAGNPLGGPSLYARRFSQGATIVPRVLFFVEVQTAGPLGAGAGRRSVRSHRSANEKRPWKHLPEMRGTVERQFLHPVHVGETILPFRPRAPQTAVIPWDGERLLTGTHERLDYYPGLAEWWREAERQWRDHRSNDALELVDRLDYQRGMQHQLPTGPHRVVYNGSGMYLAAARISDPNTVFEHKLYWAAAASLEEARYLTAVLNSTALLEVVRPLQARGEHNPRDFDKYVFQVPIPLYRDSHADHRRLVDLAEHAEVTAAGVQLPPGVSFQALRRRVRQALDAEGITREIDEATRRVVEATP